MKKRKKIVNGLIIFMLVGILIIGSQYKSTKAGINDNKLNNSTVGVFIKSGDDYILTNDIPISGYEFNAEKSYCKIGEEIQENITLNYDMNTQTLTVSPIVKEKTKCYLYFDEAANASEILLANYPTVLTRTNFSTPITNTTTGTIYKSANESQYDDFGEVYYFAGNPTDNWFYFGGYYWRIMRINGNGTIRLMYSGSDATGPVTTGEDVFIGTSVFNNSGDDNAYVGYMYTIGEQHGTERSSTIKEMIDRWYSETSGLINYEKYIDGSAGFCGDRTTTSNGTTYSTYSRFNSNSPSLICQNSNDLYTIKESGVGNEALDYPIGMASSDEIIFAGGYNGQNTNYYIYANVFYWVMSPHRDVYSLEVFDLDYYAWLGPGSVTQDGISVRPVINIRADVELTGSGTTSDPFKVVGTS